jgi:hypothetical protein
MPCASKFLGNGWKKDGNGPYRELLQSNYTIGWPTWAMPTRHVICYRALMPCASTFLGYGWETKGKDSNRVLLLSDESRLADKVGTDVGAIQTTCACYWALMPCASTVPGNGWKID